MPEIQTHKVNRPHKNKYKPSKQQRFLRYLEHLFVSRVLAALTAEVFTHALELSAKMDHSLDGRLASAAQLPLRLCRLHLCRVHMKRKVFLRLCDTHNVCMKS